MFDYVGLGKTLQLAMAAQLDVWVQVALGRVEEARQTIDAVPKQHPFALRYREVERLDWESCAAVLDEDAKRRTLVRGWADRPDG